MGAISSNIIADNKKEYKQKVGLAAKYDAFCKRQESQGVLWYLIPLMTLPAIVMPLSVMVMFNLTGYTLFVGVSILLFFTNIILTIAEQPTKTIISFYLFTVLFHIVVPLLFFAFSALLN